MVIVRTPFRVSFAGGGTDFPAFFNERSGAVISVALNKYCYLTVRTIPPFFDFHSRFIYSKIEDVTEIEEISHPAIKGCLEFLEIDHPRVGLHHDADLPSQSGLGTSGAFTVGLLKAFNSLNGRLITKRQLAFDAIKVDVEYAGDVCGWQDQVCSSYGGLNLIRFKNNGFTVEPLSVNLTKLQSHLLLFYTRQQRKSADVERLKLANDNTMNLLEQLSLVDPCLQALQEGDMELLGRVVMRSWALKRKMSDTVSNPFIDGIVSRGMDAGAYGAKVAGAGSGGSVLFVAPPQVHSQIIRALSDLVYIPVEFDQEGSQLIYYDAYTSQRNGEIGDGAGKAA